MRLQINSTLNSSVRVGSKREKEFTLYNNAICTEKNETTICLDLFRLTIKLKYMLAWMHNFTLLNWTPCDNVCSALKLILM